LSVFFVLEPAFAVETGDYDTGGVIRTIGARFKSPVPEAAKFYFTPGLIDISFSIFISQFATTAIASRARFTTGLTIRAAAPDFPY
jgi:hypothetical protein